MLGKKKQQNFYENNTIQSNRIEDNVKKISKSYFQNLWLNVVSAKKEVVKMH